MGVVRARLLEGDLAIQSTSEGDVLTQSTEHARRTLDIRLRRSGASDEQVRWTLELVDAADIGVPTQVAEDTTSSLTRMDTSGKLGTYESARRSE